jgi:3-deoxy-D-manno-octulosonic-acid transferase
MMYLIYNFILTGLAPLWVPWMWLRARKRGEQPNWSERQGNYEKSLPVKEKGKKRIWVHAVSVGEVIAAKPFLEELRKQSPQAEIVLSVTTSSGHQTAREKLTGLFDHLIYFPIDLARFQLRGVQRVRPDVIAVMETELWYNFLWAADVFDVPVFMVNARSSDRAFRRSMKFRWFFAETLALVKEALAQSEQDAERFRALGAPRVRVLGNTKFDEAAGVSPADSAHWKEELQLDDRPVVVVGSTRSELEVQLVVDALAPFAGKIQVIHAPRHLETAPELVACAKKTNFQVGLRSKKERADYLVLDSYGELGSVYSVADLVIIGGGFDTLGGQNIIQPLALGKPVLHGPNMFNFREVAAQSVEAGASQICADVEALTAAVKELLESPDKRAEMGARATELVARNVGASRRYAQEVTQELNAS